MKKPRPGQFKKKAPKVVPKAARSPEASKAAEVKENKPVARDEKKADAPADQPVNDKLENVVRDPVMYGGEIVSYVKDIGNGDPEYDANVRQVKITMPDGTEKVVPESEIMRDVKPPAQEAKTLDRPDNPPKSNLDEPKVR